MEASRLVSVAGTSITRLTKWSLDDILTWIEKIQPNLPMESMHVVEALLHDLKTKVTRIIDVGLGYLSWGQSVTTLSGGEGQRLKLAKELYKQKSDHTLYLLDEPTRGLHSTDVNKLLLLLNRLVDAGNTVIVVEHTLEVIRASDWVIDIGPEGGEAGGQVVAEGTPEQMARTEASHTGKFLNFL